MYDVFSALADPVRRRLLERLQAHGGQTVRELRARATISRQGLAKHLRVLEAANLVVVKRAGREKLHFINVAAINAIVVPWLSRLIPPPETGQRPAEEKAAPAHAKKPKRRLTGAQGGHGKWDPGREVPLWEAKDRMQAVQNERLRHRDD